ncbi:hypothetical protein [Acinetobacter sp.]|uniref:hypothetical protein n=1 Tax=Acinetobacter sp. TaxID=472 RepID=UPI00388D4902
MLTLNEALKIAGLPVKEAEDSVEDIFDRLVRSGDDGAGEISNDEKSMLISEINKKLKAGWTGTEIYLYMRWMEYFETEMSEEKCLKKMADMKAKVEARLAGEKK